MAVKDMISPKPGLNDSTVTGAGSEAQPEIKKVPTSSKADFLKMNLVMSTEVNELKSGVILANTATIQKLNLTMRVTR